MKDHPPLTAAVAVPRPLSLSPARVFAWQAAGAIACAGLMAAAGHVRVPLPFTPVPVTLQTGVALLAGATLGPAVGAAAMALYLLSGLAGLPTIATGAVLGPTAGYFVGFIAAAVVVGLLSRRGWTTMLLGMVAGDAVILLTGAAGLGLMLHLSPAQALALGVVPFLVGDAFKLIAAAATARLAGPAWRGLLGSR